MLSQLASFQRLETYHLSLLFIIQVQAERPQALGQSQRLDRLQLRYRIVALLQMIVGNAGPDMVNMMNADVAGRPLQQPWQLIK